MSSNGHTFRSLELHLLLVFAALIVLVGVSFSLVSPELAISRETTFITKPLTAAGLPDYARYMREKQRRGHGLDDDALIPLLQAAGASLIEEGQQRAALTAIGLAELPAAPKRFVPTKDYVRAHVCAGQDVERCVKERSERWGHACSDGGVGEEDRPSIAAWLEDNTSALRAIATAAEKPTLYWPRQDNGLSLLTIRPLVDMIGAVACSARLNADAERTDAALRDIVVQWKLSSLLSATGELIVTMIGAVSARNALKGFEPLFARHAVRSEPARAVIAMLAQLDYDAVFVDVIHRERVEALARQIALMEPRSPRTRVSAWERLGRALNSRHMGYNRVLRTINTLYDGLERAAHLGSFAAQERAIEAFVSREQASLNRLPWDMIACEVPGAGGMCEVANAGVQSYFNRRRVAGMPWTKLHRELPRSRSANANARVALALSLYYDDHGRYPDTLDALVPAYLAAVPVDPITTQALAYDHRGEGYALFRSGFARADIPSATDKDVALRIGVQ